jgi:hypothetical protein
MLLFALEPQFHQSVPSPRIQIIQWRARTRAYFVSPIPFSTFHIIFPRRHTFRAGEQIIIFVRLSDYFGNLCHSAENESIIVSIASFRSVFKAPEYFSEEPGISACRFSLKDRGTYPVAITLNKQHALQTLQMKIVPGRPDATQSFASISNIASIVRPSSQYMMLGSLLFIH